MPPERKNRQAFSTMKGITLPSSANHPKNFSIRASFFTQDLKKPNRLYFVLYFSLLPCTN
jgi:hypothetical protein